MLYILDEEKHRNSFPYQPAYICIDLLTYASLE